MFRVYLTMDKVQFFIDFDLNCVSIIERIITTYRNFFYKKFLDTRCTYLECLLKTFFKMIHLKIRDRR
jgi:hypothetical protein